MALRIVLPEKLRSEEFSNHLQMPSALVDSSNKDEIKIFIQDHWSTELFLSICKTYDVKVLRDTDNPKNIRIKLCQHFFKEVLWQEFQALNKFLIASISTLTEDIIEKTASNSHYSNDSIAKLLD